MGTWCEAAGAATGRRSAPSVVTVGMFDGVHLGHQHVLAHTRAAAGGLQTVAVTFEPHPVAVVRPERAPARLTTLERRVELLHEHGADEVRVLDFSAEMASWTPEEFVERVVVEQLRARHVVVGESFRFGARAAGDITTLQHCGAEHGFTAQALDLIHGDELSSTHVREHVAAGRLREAAELLGRPHEVSGVVAHGDKRGRDLGFPTANVPVPAGFAVPPDGVYAGRIVVIGGGVGPGAVEDTALPAAISIGTNPTFQGAERRVESYVMDHGHDLDLYDAAVRVELVDRVRPMVAFDSVDALVAQMHDDVCAARDLLAPG